MKIIKLFKKFIRVNQEYNLYIAIKRVIHYISNIEGRTVRKKDIKVARESKGDVLFINGCCVESPVRYRVLHQMEQLHQEGIQCAKVYSEDLDLEMEKNFKIFIFYRCEYTEEIKDFIHLVHQHNKKAGFDIDDLIIDTNEVSSLPFVQELTKEEKKLFKVSVTRIGKTLNACDFASATTKVLADRLGEIVPETYIIRNTVSMEMIQYAEAAYQEIEGQKKKSPENNMVWIGYFSGSFTHNKDFEMIKPALIKILKSCQNVSLLLVGELKPSDELNQYADRIKMLQIVEWQQLPWLIAAVDINLAPLEDTLFNRAKSEIKWMEAALARVPTVASRIGAFEEMIEDGVTGILCENEWDIWYEKLYQLVLDKSKRKEIGSQAYSYVINNCTTKAGAGRYADFIKHHIEGSLYQKEPAG